MQILRMGGEDLGTLLPLLPFSPSLTAVNGQVCSGVALAWAVWAAREFIWVFGSSLSFL